LIVATGAAGTALLGRSLSSRAGSREFYASGLGVAGTWLAGSWASGPIPLADAPTRERGARRLVAEPVAVGAGMFGLFYLAALIVRAIPSLDKALTNVLNYAESGSTPLVLSTTLANAVAEEVFFRGAVYSATDHRRPITTSTVGYVLSTTVTRNPALVLAASVMGPVFAIQRRQTGGVLAPAVTHVTWAALMVRFLPPLFQRRRPEQP
jgi:membrane protease YdiL (CAAX protease family)